MPIANTGPAPSFILSGDGLLSPLLAWQAACTTVVLQAQREQWKLLSGWQEAASAAQRDWWDVWIAHFGGGVPIDG